MGGVRSAVGNQPLHEPRCQRILAFLHFAGDQFPEREGQLRVLRPGTDLRGSRTAAAETRRRPRSAPAVPGGPERRDGVGRLPEKLGRLPGCGTHRRRRVENLLTATSRKRGVPNGRFCSSASSAGRGRTLLGRVGFAAALWSLHWGTPLAETTMSPYRDISPAAGMGGAEPPERSRFFGCRRRTPPHGPQARTVFPGGDVQPQAP